MRIIALLILSFLALSLLFPGGPASKVQAQSQNISVVYVDPLRSSGASPGSTIAIDVRVNLTATEQINGFDVRLNYTNLAVVRPFKIDYSTNIFSTGQPVTLAECIDGVYLIGTCTDDSTVGGQVHLVQSLIGTPLQGASQGLLFTVVFNVTGTGSSTFIPDRTNLVNPGTIPPNPHFVQVVKKGGVFANSGTVSFFNFEPDIPPAILPGNKVLFDASGSFTADPPSPSIATFKWDFGDGTLPVQVAIPIEEHVFSLPGVYSVQLNVTDSNGGTGSSIRLVVVVPALGSLFLRLRDVQGRDLRWDVSVKIFNLTSVTVPFLNKTIDGAGQVAFDGLIPGQYVVKFSGPSVVDDSRTLGVTGGWTTRETVYLSLRPTVLQPQDYAAIIFLGTILAGVGVATVAIVRRKRSARTKARQGRRLGRG